jgi:hypothetical protein
MTETKPRRRWFRFSVRDLLWLMTVISISIAYWTYYQRVEKYRQSFGEMHLNTKTEEGSAINRFLWWK